MGRHTVALPARIVRKCGGIKELKKTLKDNRPDDVAESHTSVIVFETDSIENDDGQKRLVHRYTLANTVELEYDAERGLLDSYEIGQEDVYIRME